MNYYTLGEYSSITEEDNEETSLVKKLFDAARNFYEKSYPRLARVNGDTLPKS